MGVFRKMQEYADYYRHLWRTVLSLWPVKLCFLAFLLVVDQVLLLHAPAALAAEPIAVVATTGAWWGDVLLRLIVWTIGPWDRFLVLSLVALFALDLIFGTLTASWRGVWTRHRAAKSVAKAFGYFGLLAVVWQARQWTGTGEPVIQVMGWVCSRILEAFMLGTELISVIENLDNFLKEVAGTNLPILPKLIAWMRRKLDEHADHLIGTGMVYRVLLVEDNALHRSLVRELMSRKGAGDFRLTVAATLTTALEELQAAEFDCILLDLNLPDSVGFGTFMAVREKKPQVPVVPFTGDEDKQLLERCELMGAKGILPKAGLTQLALLRAVVGAVESTRVEKMISARLSGVALEKVLIPDGSVSTRPTQGVLQPGGSPEHSGEWAISEVPPSNEKGTVTEHGAATPEGTDQTG